MAESEWLEIGRIVAPQGLRGEMRVYPNTDFPERFLEPGTRWLRRKGERDPQPIELLGGRDIPGKGLYVVELEGIETREAAEELRNAVLLVSANDRPELEEGEYHVLDLVGLAVFDRTTGDRLGVVTDVLSAGNDLLEVQLDRSIPVPETPPKRSRRKKPKRPKPPKPPTVLVPFVMEIVPLVDLDAGRIEIVPPPGLLEVQA
ncbi:ribosome maturation factor RimM [Baaleninema sp.]|uniref:ribosome maturation factor RimM n=1 Tax=Baaleninema sp. TaxID=3101197 RepID=UPI003CFF1882